MDLTDQKILAALARNARMSFAALGREIGLSRTAVQDRVGRLEDRGVITGYHTEYDAEAAGLVRAVLFVTIAARPCELALAWLASLSGVEEVLSLSGEIDALVRCRVASPVALTALNDRIGTSELIASSVSSLILAERGGARSR